MPKKMDILSLLIQQQKRDGSFKIVDCNNRRVKASRSVDLTLHALLLDLLTERGLVNGATFKLAKHLSASAKLPDFAVASATIDTRVLFHVLASLYEYDPRFVPPDVLARSVQFLVAHEVAPGGPYLNAFSTNETPDLATNISICRFVHALGAPLPKLLTYIEANKSITDSPYFTASWPLELQYMKMLRNVRQMTDEAALVRAVGIDEVELLYKDSEQTYGMAALTLARALPSQSTTPSLKLLRGERHPHWETANARILRYAQALDVLDPAIAEHVKAMLTRVAQTDHSKEIGLLALRFAPSLGSSQPPRRILEMLGMANLYNWAAYTVYDGILDDGGGNALLPAANTALRRSVVLFCSSVPGDRFRRFVDATFDTVDAANAWELTHCRFVVQNGTITIGSLPDYGDLENLYMRSLTHSLPLVGTLTAAGIDIDNGLGMAIMQAFKHYLIVRQLSDDLHDWQEDLRVGHISYVVARIFADACVAEGELLLDLVIPHLERVFFRQTLPAIGKEMLVRAADAHTLLGEISGIENPNVIDSLISGIEQMTQEMLTEHDRMRTFLDAYHAPMPIG